MGSSRIAGQKERDLNEIQSAAYRQVHQIRGEADGKATEIYAHAYTQNAQAAEFYNFLKSMDTYRKVLTRDSTLIFSTFGARAASGRISALISAIRRSFLPA